MHDSSKWYTQHVYAGTNITITTIVNSGYLHIYHQHANLLAIPALQVPARFCYVYKKQASGSWKILTHHSSAMPEKPTRRRSALENSVDFKTLNLEAPQGRRALLSQAEAEATAKKMFDDWIAALKTGSPTTVAGKYASKGAVLLPTVSNVVSGWQVMFGAVHVSCALVVAGPAVHTATAADLVAHADTSL
jgi:hypothetical protein